MTKTLGRVVLSGCGGLPQLKASSMELLSSTRALPSVLLLMCAFGISLVASAAMCRPVYCCPDGWGAAVK